tara:strand:+ start:141 stop:2366 length:2226 start_codon:yes stop_codon:yes gene_type:complete
MDSFIKQNFIGKDGFVWWIGQIAPEKVWIDNYGKISTESKKAWGQRYKVRIMGYHPYSIAELKDEDLPWAQVLTTAGNSGSQNTAETVRLAQGDVVVGFFLDGHNAQVPMIMGAFANTTQWDDLKKLWKKDGAPPSPFGVFGGYDKEFQEDGYAINKSSSNDNTENSDISNVQVTQGQANDRQQNDPTNEIHTTDSTTGQIVNLCDTGPTDGIKNDVLGLVKDVQALKGKMDFGNEFFRDKVKGLVRSTTESVVRKSGVMVSGMVDHAFNEIIPIGKVGLRVLYDGVFGKVLAATQNPAIAHLAGVAAQNAMLGPLNKAENLIGCLANNIIADLGGMTEDILNSVVDNVFNFTDCVGDQTVGAITNGIIEKVGGGMAGALGGLDKILRFFGGKKGFDIRDVIRNTGGASIAGQVGLRGCNEPVKRDELGPCRYRLGYGPISSSPKDLDKIVKDANAAWAISQAAKLTGFPLDGIQDIAGALDIFNSEMKVPGFKSSISDCYSGLPTICEPPKINIFGGGGFGAEAIPIFGNIVGTGSKRTGSIIDIKMTNPGNNYQFPPFVEIVDNCDQGIGAQARATVKDGKVNIYVVSEGENYPVSDQPQMAVVDVNIINPGSGYAEGDTVTDNIGNDYDIVIQSGAIVKVKPITTIAVEEVVELTVNSTTGRDALMFATIDERPEYQGVVKQQIDCVAPRTDNLVGYVKGEPYYGDFHVHPNTGKKMVGAAHTTTPHEVIYDTPQESL